MNLIKSYSQNITRMLLVKLEPNSLKFRLTSGIILIFILGLGSLTLWVSWEMQAFLMTIHQMSDISEQYRQLLNFIHNLKMMSLLLLVIMIIITTLFIQRSLLPLQQINHCKIAHNNELIPYRLKLNQTPKEIKILAQTWTELLTQLQETKEQQRQFINDLAHELRTPLSMVYGYLQRTGKRGDNLTEAQKESLEMALSDAERMTRILQNLLDLARAGSNTIPPPEPVILNDLLTNMAQMTEKFEHREIQLDLVPFPVKIKADYHQLMQIFNHLISNAVKYSDPGEAIYLRLNQIDNWAIMQVSDRGCDIPVSEQSRIFEPFYRVDPSRSRATGGVGLGLAIVKRLVVSMGGIVTVQSTPGEGNTFIVKLPII
ncbi:MAG TPA: HAMP domain-containing sensor histidine kinase [Nostocaceae cyanobacterium]|nr:HAMP domain-containing sensor histidine kinase [Nostocaceae cyanobacterium]